jgi:hypothetical protein
MQEEPETLQKLYERALFREYKVTRGEKRKAPPIIIATDQERLKYYEALIAARPSKPKTLEEEVRIKLDYINFKIFYSRKIHGLCADCQNYLRNQIINEESSMTICKEKISAIQPDDIVCTKISPNLREKEPMPAICPYYQQDEILACGLGDTDVSIWEKLKKKYESMIPASQKEPKKRF